MATMPTTSAISEERFLSEVSSKLDEITYVFAPKLPGSPSCAMELRCIVATTMLHHTPCFPGLPIAFIMLVKAVQRLPVQQPHHGS